MPQHRVILDTDIGDNIDDAFALALLLRCPEVSISTITTVFGDVDSKLDLVEEAISAFDGDCETTLRLHTGSAKSFASRPPPRLDPNWRLHYYASNRSIGLRDDWNSAHRAIALSFNRYGVRTSDVLLLGPHTNIAIGIVSAPSILGTSTGLHPRSTVAMAGEFDLSRYVESNIRADPEASHQLFSSGIPVEVVPWSIGRLITLDDVDVARLRNAAERGERLIALLLNWLEQFWRHFPGKTSMCDPAAVVALLHPEWFDWRRGRVSVELRDEALYGLTRFEADDSGPHRVAFGIESDKVKRFMLDRICGSPE